MGDAGLAIGAAYLCGRTTFKWLPKKIDSVYLGPDITESHLEKSKLMDLVNIAEELIAFAGKRLGKR